MVGWWSMATADLWCGGGKYGKIAESERGRCQIQEVKHGKGGFRGFINIGWKRYPFCQKKFFYKNIIKCYVRLCTIQAKQTD